VGARYEAHLRRTDVRAVAQVSSGTGVERRGVLVPNQPG
jgi:hypothetical protein